jgi:hypothetical protein
LPLTYFSKQWAAVNTHCGDINVPPQKCWRNLEKKEKARILVQISLFCSLRKQPERHIDIILIRLPVLKGKGLSPSAGW